MSVIFCARYAYFLISADTDHRYDPPIIGNGNIDPFACPTEAIVIGDFYGIPFQHDPVAHLVIGSDTVPVGTGHNYSLFIDEVDVLTADIFYRIHDLLCHCSADKFHIRPHFRNVFCAGYMPVINVACT